MTAIKGAASLVDQLKMLRGVEPMTPQGATTPPTKTSFMEYLQQNFTELNQTGLDVEKKIQDSVEGKTANPHETMIAIQKADVSFRLMLTVKDQLEQAYQQIMRTTIG